MSKLGLLIGLAGFTFTLLAFTGTLKSGFIIPVALMFVIAIFIAVKNECLTIWLKIPKKPIELTLIALILIALVIALLGVIIPEIQFDALWYHLTLPKLYLNYGRYLFTAERPFFYTTLPQLTEMLYIPTLLTPGTVLPKLIHAMFGVFTAVTIISVSLRKKLLSPAEALLAALLFLTDVSVTQQMSTAGNDLTRTFFETVGIMTMISGKSQKSMFVAGLLFGLAASTKTLALASVAIATVIAAIKSKSWRVVAIFIGGVLITGSFWYLNSYLHTKNPVFPLFSATLSSENEQLNLHPANLIPDLLQLTLKAENWDSAVSPILLLSLVLIFVPSKRMAWFHLKIYVFLSVLAWFVIPRVGGTRFFLPLLPSLSLITINAIPNNKFVRKLFTALVCVLIASNLVIRLKINAKAFPLLTGQQSTQEFLILNSNPTSTFIDRNNLTATVKGSESVCVRGGQNLFYVPYPFYHEAFGFPDNCVYLLELDTPLQTNNSWSLINQNDTGTERLYKARPNSY